MNTNDILNFLYVASICLGIVGFATIFILVSEQFKERKIQNREQEKGSGTDE